MSLKPAMPPLRVTVIGNAAAGFGLEGLEGVELLPGPDGVPDPSPAPPEPPEPDPHAASVRANEPATMIRTSCPVRRLPTSVASCVSESGPSSQGCDAAPAPAVPSAVRLVPCRAPVSGGPPRAGLGSVRMISFP